MNDNHKFDYFIEETNKRFDKIDRKLEELINFRMMLLGGAFAISAIVSLLMAVWKH